MIGSDFKIFTCTNREGSALSGCASLISIVYDGTMQDWDNVKKGADWDFNTGEYIVYCTDGEIAKNSD